MNTGSNTEFIEVFSGDYLHVSMIEQMLENNNIPLFVKNALMGSIEPIALTGGTNATSAQVPAEFEAAALKLIDDFKTQFGE